VCRIGECGCNPGDRTGTRQEQEALRALQQRTDTDRIDPGTAELDQTPTGAGVIKADQNGPVLLIVTDGGRPGQGIVVEDDNANQTAIALPS
jgi:hypothetical protein